MRYNSEEREATIAEMEQLLKQLNQHVEYLTEANKRLKQIDADTKKMETYYFSEWLEDYSHFESKKSYNVLLQDPIYNVLQEIHEEKLKLIKRIVKNLR